MTSNRPLVIAVTLVTLIAPGIWAAQSSSAEKTWSKVMYLGGVAGVRGKSLDWDNQLTISKETITFTGKKINFEIETKSIRRLDYTGHRHMNDGSAATGFAAAGLLGALAGSSVKSTDHYLELSYTLADGSPGGLLLRLHKDNQQAIIDAVYAATGIEK